MAPPSPKHAQIPPPTPSTFGNCKRSTDWKNEILEVWEPPELRGLEKWGSALIDRPPPSSVTEGGAGKSGKEALPIILGRGVAPFPILISGGGKDGCQAEPRGGAGYQAIS